MIGNRLVLFKAMASPTLGGGHVVRCLALADACLARGWRCGFLADITTRAMMAEHFRERPNLSIIDVFGRNPEATLSACHGMGPSAWLVIDDYMSTHQEERLLTTMARRLLVLDDFAVRKHGCHMLLDTTPARKMEDYRGLVPFGATILAGREYSLIRKSVRAQRNSSLERRNAGKLSRILVTFGLSQVTDWVLMALRAIVQSGVVAEVDVIVGNQEDAERIRKGAPGGLSVLRLHANVSQPGPLIAAADLAIGTPGVSSLERCVLGVPTLHVVTAPHQQAVADQMDEEDVAELIVGPDLDSTIARRIGDLASNPAELVILARNSAAYCDGLGADRVAACMEKEDHSG